MSLVSTEKGEEGMLNFIPFPEKLDFWPKTINFSHFFRFIHVNEETSHRKTIPGHFFQNFPKFFYQFRNQHEIPLQMIYNMCGFIRLLYIIFIRFDIA